MNLSVEVISEINNSQEFIPSTADIEHWLQATLEPLVESAEVCISIVSNEKIKNLNAKYRFKNKETNVLSFPAELPEQIASNFLGDIIIAAAVIKKEAENQNKDLNAHWAHIVIHGALHLLGYDHQSDAEANVMEQLEVDSLRKLGFANPYGVYKS